RSTKWWNGVPRGTMDEVSSRVCLDLPTARPPKRSFHLAFESHDGRAYGADSGEKHEPASDIDAAVVDGLKALDPSWPIREADSCTAAKITLFKQLVGAAGQRQRDGDAERLGGL